MIQRPAGAAFMTGGTSAIGLGIARELVSAGAGIALADHDGARLTDAVRHLASLGGKVTGVLLDASDPADWQRAADRAEEAVGPISLVCDLAARPGPEDGAKPFRLCRWTQRIAADTASPAASTFALRRSPRRAPVRLLTTAPISSLAARALLVPGAVSSRVEVTTGVANPLLLGAGIAEVSRKVVDALAGMRYLLVTDREWAGAADALGAASVVGAQERFGVLVGADLISA